MKELTFELVEFGGNGNGRREQILGHHRSGRSKTSFGRCIMPRFKICLLIGIITINYNRDING
jgi:hypothetical protein